MEKEIYFSNEALARFVSAQGKSVKAIICHLWVNRVNPDAQMEIIDNLMLVFDDGQKLCIGCNNDGDGLDALAFDLNEANRALKEEFGDKIKILPANASGTKMWSDVIGKKLEAVRLSRSDEHYKADSLVLDFGEEKREVSVSPTDGLIIDYYEA